MSWKSDLKETLGIVQPRRRFEASMTNVNSNVEYFLFKDNVLYRKDNGEYTVNYICGGENGRAFVTSNYQGKIKTSYKTVMEFFNYWASSPHYILVVVDGKEL